MANHLFLGEFMQVFGFNWVCFFQVTHHMPCQRIQPPNVSNPLINSLRGWLITCSDVESKCVCVSSRECILNVAVSLIFLGPILSFCMQKCANRLLFRVSYNFKKHTNLGNEEWFIVPINTCMYTHPWHHISMQIASRTMVAASTEKSTQYMPSWANPFPIRKPRCVTPIPLRAHTNGRGMLKWETAACATSSWWGVHTACVPAATNTSLIMEMPCMSMAAGNQNVSALTDFLWDPPIRGHSPRDSPVVHPFIQSQSGSIAK